MSTVLLKKKYDALKSSMANQLKKIKIINLIIDLWSNQQMRSCLGITGHYISDQWTLESVILGHVHVVWHAKECANIRVVIMCMRVLR